MPSALGLTEIKTSRKKYSNESKFDMHSETA